MTLLDYLVQAVERKYNSELAQTFKGKIIEYNNGVEPVLDGLSDYEQIDIMNDIIRYWLLNHNNTVEVRAWLTQAENLYHYVYSFEKHWLIDICKLNLLK